MDDNYSKIFNHMIVTFGKFNNKKLDSGEQMKLIRLELIIFHRSYFAT